MLRALALLALAAAQSASGAAELLERGAALRAAGDAEGAREMCALSSCRWREPRGRGTSALWSWTRTSPWRWRGCGRGST